MLQSLLPFTLFALVTSISPGPTNVLILAHSARAGLRASVAPIVAAEEEPEGEPEFAATAAVSSTACANQCEPGSIDRSVGQGYIGACA